MRAEQAKNTNRYQTRNEKLKHKYSKTGTEEKDAVLYVILMQIFLAICFLLLVFCMGKSNSDFYRDLKDGYAHISQKDFGTEEFSNVFKSFTADLKDKQKAFDGRGGEDAPFYGKKASFSPLAVTPQFYMPVKYKRISSPFGMRENPITQKMGFHTGIDLAAPMDTPIYAAYSGTVEQTAETKGRGKYVLLAHGNGLETLYCHCSKIAVQEGAKIQGGEQIAFVGSTGQSTGPHLHFEVRLNGVSYNPIWLFSEHGI